MKYTKLGFNYYGTGNIGDDMTLKGFLLEWRDFRPLFGIASPKNVPILAKRFPEVLWLVEGTPEPEFDLWLGVGDTPLQIDSGDYLLSHMESQFAKCTPSCRIALLGIGAEKEIRTCKDRIHHLLQRVDFINTRDDWTYKFLHEQVGLPPQKLSHGADLANIFLADAPPASPPQNPRRYKLGVNCYTEQGKWIDQLRLFKSMAKSRDAEFILLFCNETRCFKGTEANNAILIGSLTRLLYGDFPRNICIPEYATSRVEQFLSVYDSVECLASSRYHALLAGAWRGCHLIALDRRSKVTELAVQLQLPVMSIQRFADAISTSVPIGEFHAPSKSILNEMKRRALTSVQLLKDWMQGSKIQSFGSCP